MAIAVGARILADDIEDLAVATGSVLGRCRRTTSSSGSASTTLVPVLRMDTVVPIVNGRAYNIRTSALFVDASVANDVGRLVITYTTDGSAPTISSTVLPGCDGTTPPIANIAVAVPVTFETTYVAAADGSLRLLLSVARFSGTGTIVILGSATALIEMKVIDGGVDPGDTGTDL